MMTHIRTHAEFDVKEAVKGLKTGIGMFLFAQK